jgi:uncharacterized membrane protein
VPYESTFSAKEMAPDHSGAILPNPTQTITLWPYRSLPRTGFVWFIGATATLISVPALALIGTPELWGVLPFLVLAVAAIYWALQRSYRDAEIVERLTLWPDRITLLRLGPRGARADWEANPYWVSPVLHTTGGPVPNYLTLRGGDREVELGAFLSEPERIALHADITRMLGALR